MALAGPRGDRRGLDVESVCPASCGYQQARKAFPGWSPPRAAPHLVGGRRLEGRARAPLVTSNAELPAIVTGRGLDDASDFLFPIIGSSMTESDGTSSPGIGRAIASALVYSSSTSCGVSRPRGHSGSASRNVRPWGSVRSGTDGV